MRVHLDEGETTVSLEARLDNKAKVLEQRNDIIGGGVWGQVADVDGSLPRGSLGQNNVVATNTMRGELVVTKRRGGSQTHSLHGLLLGNRWLTLLVGPVAANSARSEPLAIHGAESLFGIRAVAESDETVATRATSLHVPHDAGFRNGAKSRERLSEDLVVDLVGQVSNKDMEVAGGILLAGGIGLIGPVDADFLSYISPVSLQRTLVTYGLVNTAAIEGLHGAVSSSRVVVLDEAVVEALGL